MTDPKAAAKISNIIAKIKNRFGNFHVTAETMITDANAPIILTEVVSIGVKTDKMVHIRVIISPAVEITILNFISLLFI